jgi:GTP-sensing pleiotropic transcriptional regulator CodY
MARRQAIGQEPSSPVPMSEETVIAVLVEALQGAEVLVSASMVASRLAARGVVVTAAQVERIFTRYGLEPGKKTVD